MTFAGIPSHNRDGAPDLADVGSAIRLARNLAGSGYEFSGDSGAELYTGLFLLAYIIPLQGESSTDRWVEDAKALWTCWISGEGDGRQDMKNVVGGLVKEKLRSVIVDEEAETRSANHSYVVLFFVDINLPGLNTSSGALLRRLRVFISTH